MLTVTVTIVFLVYSEGRSVVSFMSASHLGVQRSLEAGGDADGTGKIKDSSSSAGSRLVPARSNSSISIH